METETTTETDAERRTMDENPKREMNIAINKDEVGIDLSEIRPLSKEQEDVVLMLELSRLRKKGVITLETFMKTAKEWKI